MIEVYCDGACRGNGIETMTNAAAIGIAIYRNNKLIGTYCRALGDRSSAEAEYEALIHSLLWCWTLSTLDSDFLNPIIYTDSQTVHNQVQGIWNCKSPKLIPLLDAVHRFSSSGYNFRLIQVKRDRVAEADSLANMLLDELLNNT